MKLSLVLATIERTDELDRFLFNLSRQTCRDFELIVVDQNPDDRVAKILASYLDSFTIVHVRTNKNGAARARNLGLKHAQGELIGFPDDDCWYSPDLLKNVLDFFEHHPQWDGLCGRATDTDGNTVALHFDKQAGIINRYNAWRRGLTFTMFFRRTVINASALFDEQLGVGASTPWGSGEETDLLIRLVDTGCRIHYEPGLTFFHPDPLQCDREKLFWRAYSYGCGFGKVMKINNYPGWYFLYYLLRSAGGAVLALTRADWPQAAFYRESFRGRLYGWRKG